jgi:hypothetical protein
MPTLETLPEETICRIVDFLGDHRESLKSLAQTNLRLSRLSRARLWDTFRVRMVWGDPECTAVKRIWNVLQHANLCSLIGNVEIHEGFSSDWGSHPHESQSDDSTTFWQESPHIAPEESGGWYRSLSLLLKGATAARSLGIQQIYCDSSAPVEFNRLLRSALTSTITSINCDRIKHVCHDDHPGSSTFTRNLIRYMSKSGIQKMDLTAEAL